MLIFSADLIVVAINMLNIKEFIHIGKHAPKSDFIVLMATLCSGVLVDLLFAVEVGIVATAILFMKRMSEVTEVHHYDSEEHSEEDFELLPHVPKDTVIYELMGPMFFAGLDTFHRIVIPVTAKCLILQMHSVPALDNAGVQALDNLYKRCDSMGVQLILSDVHTQPMKVLGKYGLVELLGEENLCRNITMAIERAQVLSEE